MDMTCIDKINEYMEYELTEKRIRHTEGVVETAVALAKKLGRLAYVRIGVYEVAAFLIYATQRVG